MHDFYNGFGIFTGVIVGVVAGSAVTLFTQWILARIAEGREVRNMRFELGIDVKKIDAWLDSLSDYRNAINAGKPELFAGYFDLSRFVLFAYLRMFFNGTLYKYLDHDQIGKLQVVASEFSINWETLMNQQIAENRALFYQGSKTQGDIAQYIDFWERKFKDHKATLSTVLGKLGASPP